MHICLSFFIVKLIIVCHDCCTLLVLVTMLWHHVNGHIVVINDNFLTPRFDLRKHHWSLINYLWTK